MLIIGGILFPVFAIITIAALFIWSFYELGVYIDELLNEKENDLGVELENVLTWIDIKVSGNQDLVDQELTFFGIPLDGGNSDKADL